MLLNILISLVIAGLFSVATLLLVRQRLSSQFGEIFRRFAQVRDVLKVLDGAEKNRISVNERFKDLNVALTRIQERTAHRFGPLAPLARELSPTGGPRDLSEREIHQLVRHWAPKFEISLTENDVRWFLRALKRSESLWLDDVPSPTIDIVARAVAVLGLKRRELRIADVAADGGLLPLFLQRAGEMFFDRMEIAHVGGGEPSLHFQGIPRPEAALIFARRAKVAGDRFGAAKYFDSVESLLDVEHVWDGLLLGTGRLVALSPEARASLLGSVAAGGFVILCGEDAAAETESLSQLASGLDRFEVVTSAWKTAVLRKLS